MLKLFVKLIVRFIVAPAVIALAIFSALAFTGTSQTNAIALAAIAALILPLLLKYVPAAGHYMVAISVVASAGIAAGAELLSGEIVLTNLQGADTSALLALVLSVYGLSQFVYAALSQSAKTAGAVS